ncbi:hypothetical protein D9M68_953690 [compost metagenome]
MSVAGASDNAALDAAAALAAVVAAMPAVVASSDTALSCPVRPVDFSACVADVVRR